MHVQDTERPRISVLIALARDESWVRFDNKQLQGICASARSLSAAQKRVARTQFKVHQCVKSTGG